MKSSTLLFGLFVLMLICVVVESFSQSICQGDTCSASQCEAVNCQCGTVKDSCECCDLCKACGDAACSLVRGDTCQEGYRCAHPVGTSSLNRINGDGKCVTSGSVNEEGFYSP